MPEDMPVCIILWVMTIFSDRPRPGAPGHCISVLTTFPEMLITRLELVDCATWQACQVKTSRFCINFRHLLPVPSVVVFEIFASFASCCNQAVVIKVFVSYAYGTGRPVPRSASILGAQCLKESWGSAVLDMQHWLHILLGFFVVTTCMFDSSFGQNCISMKYSAMCTCLAEWALNHTTHVVHKARHVQSCKLPYLWPPHLRG